VPQENHAALTALVIGFAGQPGEALAYACNNNYYVNSYGHLYIPHPVARSTKSARRNAAMAALAFQSIAVGRARIMVVLHTGIEQPLGMAVAFSSAVPRGSA